MIGGRSSIPASAAAAVLERIDAARRRAPDGRRCRRSASTGSTSGEPSDHVPASGRRRLRSGEPILDLLRRDLPVLVDELGPRDVPRAPGARRDPALRPAPLLEGPLPPRAGRCDCSTRARRTRSARDDAVGSAFVLLEADRRRGTGSSRRVARHSASGRRAGTPARSRSGSRHADDDRRSAGRGGSPTMLEPASLNGAGYVNYSPVDETPDRVRAAYGDERWARLVARQAAATTRTTCSGSTTTSCRHDPAAGHRAGRGRLDAARPRCAPAHPVAHERAAMRLAGSGGTGLPGAQRHRQPVRLGDPATPDRAAVRRRLSS